MNSLKQVAILHFYKKEDFYKIWQKYLNLVVYICLILPFTALTGCGEKQNDHQDMASEKRGLVNKYCSSCHLPVDPSMLDRKTWKEHVLPAMAEKLGLGVWRGPAYYSKKESAISIQDWQKIIAYYDSLAPVTLIEKNLSEKPAESWSGFSLKKPDVALSGLATTTLVGFDPDKKRIYTSDAITSRLYEWQTDLKKFEIRTLPSPSVHVNFTKGLPPVLTLIGDMKAVDLAVGSVQKLTGENQPALTEIGRGFIRPVQTLAADFNKDGLADYLVSSFGHNQGGLYLLSQSENHSFKRTAVREVPGATQSIVRDFNQDGWPDVMCLFAHGDEGIWLFLNDKEGGFSSRNILRFPPVYGSSSFDYADIDGDGKPEIIYTSGDNSDYSKVLKPYHGLYIFSDLGDFKFEKNFFYPINGSTKAIAADFDKDGRKDIAVINFFADLKNKPWETFLYFKQEKTENSKLRFTPYVVPIHDNGRWICMDVSDFDGDGDDDIILGNYSKGFLNQLPFRPDWNTRIPFIVLQNDSGK